MNGIEKCEVAIVGGGLAGLSTALRLADHGVPVMVLEKGRDEHYPCNARFSGGVFHICFHHVNDDEARLVEAIRQNTRGFAKAELAAAVARDTRTAVQWLKGKGIQFIKGGQDTFRENTLAPALPAKPGLNWPGRGADVLMQTLARALENGGGRLLRGASAKRLRMDGVRCVGLETEYQGRAVSVDARSVVLCDGGFQANLALLREYVMPKPEKLKQRNAGTGNGDALQMAREVGAQLVGMDRFYGHLLARDAMHNDALWPYPMVDFVCTAGILVDAAGRRFVDEGLGGVYMTNQLARLADPLSAVLVYDEAIWNGPGHGHVLPANPHLIAGGAKIHKAQDLRSLGVELGLPAGALEATIAEYNAALAADQSARLAPPRTAISYKPYPIKQPPYYALPLCAGITFTMGGIATDDVGRVLNGQNVAIPGLYAAGCCTGGLDGGPNAGYVGGLAKSAAMGLRTADHLAALAHVR
ncbi:MAG TPA: FAD-dependent oxidoreductase [Burkholderiales bacterium]|nr:FAD-dependent oxidoreductase [Burkholderiales bacterium]